MNRKLSSSIAALFVLSGCTTIDFTETGNNSGVMAKSVDCEVSVYTIPPSTPFKEVGIIEFGGWNPLTGVLNGPKNVKSLKEKVQSTVCLQGGNGILAWEATITGSFEKATIILVE